jgi:hypothetical protein
VKSKAASKFNAAVDAPMNAAKNKVKGKQQGNKQQGGKQQAGAQQGGKQQASAQQQGGSKGMLFFRKKSKGGGSSQGQPQGRQMPEEFSENEKTMMVNVSEMMDDRAQDCVGWIVALNGAQRGKDFRLVSGRNVIGTAADCDIVLTDAYLSSKHAAIRHENGRFTLIDLDSTNGTYMNDRRISKEELIDNDKIRLGRTELKFKSLY